MPELKSREVKDICLSNLWKLFDGEITKEELDQKVNEVERQIALGEVTLPSLFDQNDRSIK
jgi:hypothetical protein